MKKENILDLLDYVALAGLVGGLVWAIASYVIATWDLPPVLVTTGTKFLALWKPLLLVTVSSIYLKFRT